jgi:hypothetical protein
MNYLQLCEGIKRVKIAIEKSKSVKLIRDYKKHLFKLIREKKDYERFIGVKNTPPMF